ncbi:MAG: tetratricopeptide repeat protein [Pseudomonadota bacterium]
MNKDFTKSIIILFSLLCFSGCSVPITNSFSKATIVNESDFPENKYFYFTESQILKKKGDIKKATEYMEQALQLDPESLFLKGELVNLYLQKKENDKALFIVEDVLKKEPENIGALILFGKIKHSLNQTDDAKKIYEKIVETNPKEKNIYLLLGSIYLDKKDFSKAEGLFEKLVKNFPDYYLGYFYLGKIYVESGNLIEAEKSFNKAIKLKSDMDESRYELINIYKIKNENKKTIQVLKEMLENNPHNIRAALDLGCFYKKNDMRKEAEKILFNLGERSLADFDVILNLIQFYLNTRRYNDAILILEDIQKGAPDNSDLNYISGLFFLAIKNEDAALKQFLKVKNDSKFYFDMVFKTSLIYQSKGMNKEALSFIKDAIVKEPGNPNFQYYLSLFYEDLKDYENAEKALLSAIEKDPNDPAFYFRLGVIYDKWGKKDKTIEQMKKVIKIDPQNADALNYLGYTYAEMEKYLNEAEQLILEAMKHKPGDGYITDSLGWVYFKKGKYLKAVDVLKKAVDLVPEDPVVLEHLGDAYMKINEINNALDTYSRSLKFKKEDREVLIKKIQEISGKEL